MLTSLLPGVRDLRAPLAAGYLWLLFGWLVLEPHYGSLGLTRPFLNAISSIERQLSPAGLAIAASFAAYLIGSLSFSLTDNVRRYPRIVYRWAVTRGWAPASANYRLAMLGPTSAMDPKRVISDPPLGQVAVPSQVPVPLVRRFLTNVLGWGRDLLRTLDTAGVSEDVYWETINGELRIYDSPIASEEMKFSLELFLAARVYEERELIADGLLDEKSDLYGAVDRLRGEIELRDAVLLPLLALIVLLALTVGIYWFVALVAIVGLVLQRSDLDGKRQDRLLAAVTWRPNRAPTLARIERVVRAAITPENLSNATAE